MFAVSEFNSLARSATKRETGPPEREAPPQAGCGGALGNGAAEPADGRPRGDQAGSTSCGCGVLPARI